MEESDLHQPTIGPYQGNDSPHQAESGGSQHNHSVVNSQQKGDHEGSGQTTHTNRSQLRGKSHVSHAENHAKNEIGELKKKLRRARQRRSSFRSKSSFEDTEDVMYRQRSRTPSNETFSGDEEYSSHRRKSNSTSHKGLGNKAMNEALNQVAKSPFTRRIEGANLPQRFNQPTFSLYNGWTNPVEHVGHFNQKMVVHSKDEALMCKIFPSSLGPMAMR